MYDKIKRWYELGLWSPAMVGQAVGKKKITQTQADEILGTGAGE